jgi:hypothetical protein
MAGLLHGLFPALALEFSLSGLLLPTAGIFSCADFQLAQQGGETLLKRNPAGVAKFTWPPVPAITVVDGDPQLASGDELHSRSALGAAPSQSRVPACRCAYSSRPATSPAAAETKSGFEDASASDRP